MNTPRQGTALFTGISALIATLVIIQLWLVSAALDAFLGGEVAVLAPAAVASVALFLVNGALLLHVNAFDRRLARGASNEKQ